MEASRLRRHFVAVMAKHLPPSSSTMRLLDLDGVSGRLLAASRKDLKIRHIPVKELAERGVETSAFDAVLAYDLDLSDTLLKTSLTALREGGRLIALQTSGAVSESHWRRLQDQGYVRILIEPALDEIGVLIRGEKPHSTDDTLARIGSIARGDGDSLDLAQFNGRYIHLLIQQHPNRPVWKLAPGEKIAWRAAAIRRNSKPVLLGFSSLPKAVSFMQPAVLAGFIADINKVAKFTVEQASGMDWDIILNPIFDTLQGESLTLIDVDPALAEAPDE